MYLPTQRIGLGVFVAALVGAVVQPSTAQLAGTAVPPFATTVDLPDTCQVIDPCPPSPFDTRVWFTNSHVDGGSCTGTITVDFLESAASQELGVSDRVRASVDGAQTSIDPTIDGIPWKKVAKVLGKALGAVALVVGVLMMLGLFSITDPAGVAGYEWDYSCTADSYGVSANGDGGLMRRIAIETPDDDGGSGADPVAYHEIGTPCEYIGTPVNPSCAHDASYENPTSTPAGSDAGYSALRRDAAGQYYVDPPIPGMMRICIDPKVRAVNVAQVPAMAPVFRSSKAYVGEICLSHEVCIDWVALGQLLGCLAD